MLDGGTFLSIQILIKAFINEVILALYFWTIIRTPRKSIHLLNTFAFNGKAFYYLNFENLFSSYTKNVTRIKDYEIIIK